MSPIFQILPSRYIQAKQKKSVARTHICVCSYCHVFATEAVRYPRSAVLLANHESGNFLVVQRGAAEKWFETRTNRWSRATCSEHVSAFSTLAN